MTFEGGSIERKRGDPMRRGKGSLTGKTTSGAQEYLNQSKVHP